EFIKVQGLEGKMEATKIKRKWENLKQKYKELKAPRTGVSTEGGETTAASWKWYGPMDEALGGRPSISPPVLVGLIRPGCGSGLSSLSAPEYPKSGQKEEGV
ncbi:unnamed protein product, partial [Gadus morhua 'NCC']